MKKYCSQNNGDCSTCSLVNYGRDCQNNLVASGDDMKSLFHAIETETCPICLNPLDVVTTENDGKIDGASYTCSFCGWESGFCTPAPHPLS